MKRRVRKIVNFFAFNLLFFALYLNFIHKDKPQVNFAIDTAQGNTAAFSNSELVNTQQEKKEPVKVQPAETKTQQDNTAALKLSIN